MRFISKNLLTLIPVAALALTTACSEEDDNGNGGTDMGGNGGTDMGGNGGTDMGGNGGTDMGGNGGMDMGLPARCQASIVVDGETITDPAGMGRPFCIFDAANGDAVVDMDMNWNPGFIYVLTGDTQGQSVSIASGRTLNIAAGTTIYAETVPLVIPPGATINITGEVDNPVTITSINRLVQNASPGDHGGLVVAGLAPANCLGEGGEQCTAEASLPDYGGNDPMDNSGTIRYLRIEFGGTSIDEENQYNGLSLYAVGAGTTIEYVHIHRNLDDGIEWFGGTVDVRYALITGCEDDSLDWTDGWTGRLQFAAIQQWASGATENGIEADNDGSAPNNMPRSLPIISNMTIVARGDHMGNQRGMLLRRGTGGQFWNSIVAGGDVLAEVRNAETLTDIAFVSDILHPNVYASRDGVTDMEVQMLIENSMNVTVAGTDVSPADVLVDPTNTADPDLGILSTGPANGYMPTDVGDDWFMDTNFIGAIDPANDWTNAAWISFPAN